MVTSELVLIAGMTEYCEGMPQTEEKRKMADCKERTKSCTPASLLDAHESH
jgi:hypothetical protein